MKSYKKRRNSNNNEEYILSSKKEINKNEQNYYLNKYRKMYGNSFSDYELLDIFDKNNYNDKLIMEDIKALLSINDKKYDNYNYYDNNYNNNYDNNYNNNYDNNYNIPQGNIDHPVFNMGGEPIDDNGYLVQYLLENGDDSYVVGLENTSNYGFKLYINLEGLDIIDGNYKGMNRPAFTINAYEKKIFNIKVKNNYYGNVSFQFEYA